MGSKSTRRVARKPPSRKGRPPGPPPMGFQSRGRPPGKGTRVGARSRLWEVRDKMCVEGMSGSRTFEATEQPRHETGAVLHFLNCHLFARTASRAASAAGAPDEVDI